MLLISAPLSATLTPNAGFTDGGRLICTNASPPEIRSARFESTIISGPAAAAGVDSEHASTAAGNNKRHIELIVHFILIPPLGHSNCHLRPWFSTNPHFPPRGSRLRF